MSMDSGAGGQGRDADFDETFRLHYALMVRSLGVACGDHEAAADAVQEAFVKAYARWRRVGRYDSPAGWVRHVALNRLRDQFRRLERGDRAYRRFEADHRNDATLSDRPEAGDEVMAELSTLPRQQRVALSLFYVEELSVNEVATTMGLSPGAVKYHLHAGRTSLRTRLDTR